MEAYTWENIEGVCAEFVAMCLYCLTGKTGHKIPRPLSMTVNGTKPNEVIHFDFFYTVSMDWYGPQDWPLIIDMRQHSLNEAPLVRLGTRGDRTYRTSLEVMNGLKPARVMLRTSQIGDAQCEVKNMEKAKAMEMLEIDGLQTLFAEMHKDVAKKVTKNRARQIKHHDKKMNLIVPEFGLGDFVLVRRAQNKGQNESFQRVRTR